MASLGGLILVLVLQLINYLVVADMNLESAPGYGDMAKFITSSSSLSEAEAAEEIVARLNGRTLRVTILGQGSLGDLYPLWIFARGMEDRYPWFKIDRVMAHRGCGAERLISGREDVGFCPLNVYTINEQIFKDNLQKYASGDLSKTWYEWLLEREDFSRSFAEAIRGTDILIYSTYYADRKARILATIEDFPELKDIIVVDFSPLTSIAGYLELFEKNRIVKMTNPEVVAHMSTFMDGRPYSAALADEALADRVPELEPISKVFLMGASPPQNTMFVGAQVPPAPDAAQYAAGLDASLRDFVHESAVQRVPLVYIGFGSMGQSWGHILNPNICSMITQLPSLRFLWHVTEGVPKGLTGSELCLNSPHAYILQGSVNHGWLFPYVHTTVHHGGMGTTQTSLYYGAASVVVPHALEGDQKMVGALVTMLKVGAATDSARTASHGWLTSAVLLMTFDRAIRSNVSRYSDIMKEETRVNIGSQFMVKYILQKLATPRITTDRSLIAEEPCVFYDQELYLKNVETQKYCRFKKRILFTRWYPYIKCDVERDRASKFFVTSPASLLEGPPRYLRTSFTGLIAFKMGERTLKLRPGFVAPMMSVNGASRIDNRRVFRFIAEKLPDNQTDVCIRFGDPFSVQHNHAEYMKMNKTSKLRSLQVRGSTNRLQIRKSVRNGKTRFVFEKVE